MLKIKVLKINHSLIILLYLTIVDALAVLHIYYVCVVEILYKVVFLCISSKLHVQWR